MSTHNQADNSTVDINHYQRIDLLTRISCKNIDTYLSDIKPYLLRRQQLARSNAPQEMIDECNIQIKELLHIEHDGSTC